MKKRKEYRKTRQDAGSGKPCTLAEGLQAWLVAHGGPERLRLSLLWKNWERVVGPDAAALALPLGHRRQALLLGAEDNLAMQELTFLGPEILHRANAFMAEAGQNDYFSKIEAHLMLGRETLGQQAAPRPALPGPASRPALSGQICLPPGPVRDCYEAWVKATKKS